MEYPMPPFQQAVPNAMAGTGPGNPGPGLLEGMDNSINVPPSWRTGPSGSISTGTHSVELAGEHFFAEPSMPSHRHASGPGGMPMIAMPPEIAPLPALHRLELEQQFLHPHMPLYSSMPMPTPHTSMLHAFPSQDQVIMELRNEIAELKNTNTILDTRYTTLFSAYNSLLRRIPNAVGFNVEPLEREDYPDVKFWYLADWTDFCSNGSVSTTGAGGTNPQPAVAAAMKYIEDQRGQAVDGESVLMMRSLAQSIWFELGITGAATLATSWVHVDVQSKKGYYRAMAASFFNLRLCASDWKAEKIAEDNYGLWHLRWRVQTQGPEPSHQSKRTRNASTVAQAQTKKSRVKGKEPSRNLVDQGRDSFPEKQAARTRGGA